MYKEFPWGLTEAGEARAAGLHAAATIVDGLGGSMLMRPPPEVDGRDRIDQYRDAGVRVSCETIAMPDEDARTTLKRIADYHALEVVAGARAGRVRTVQDVAQHHGAGTLGLVYGLQSADGFEGDPYLVGIFRELGVRIANLVYNGRNRLGDGCLEPENRGLTAFGKAIVLEMNRVGITVDLSHTGERTSLDAAAVSSAPVVFSHSNARGLSDHPRNLSDDQIRAAAVSGGVVGLCPHSQFCRGAGSDRPTLQAFLDHVVYVAELVGVETVAVGTDLFGGNSLGEAVFRFQFGRLVPGAWGGFDLASKYVVGFDTVAGWRNVTRGLVARGFSDDEVLAILGGNWLRVFERTWSGAGIEPPARRGVPA